MSDPAARKDAAHARSATDPATSALANAIAMACINGGGPWTAATAVLESLECGGYTVAARASQPAPLLPPRPMTDEEAAEFERKWEKAADRRATWKEHLGPIARAIVDATQATREDFALMPPSVTAETTAARASQGAQEPASPEGGPEAADGGDKAAAGRTEARPVDLAFAALGQWFHGPDYAAEGHASNPGECDPCWDSAEIASIAIALGTSDITTIREHMEGVR
jgi:hypothetical protein